MKLKRGLSSSLVAFLLLSLLISTSTYMSVPLFSADGPDDYDINRLYLVRIEEITDAIADKLPITRYEILQRLPPYETEEIASLGVGDNTSSNYTFTTQGNINVLWSYENKLKNARVEFKVLGDINGDGIRDVVISDSNPLDSRLLVVSGRDGTPIYSKTYPNPISIDTIGENIVVLQYKYDASLNMTYMRVELLKGQTGEELFHMEKSLEGEFGWIAVHQIYRDLNKNGTEDLLVEGSNWKEKKYIMVVLDGKDLTELWSKMFDEHVWGYKYAWHDLTGDGIPDFVVSSYDWERNAGKLFIIRGSDGFIYWSFEFVGRHDWPRTWRDFDGDRLNDIVITIRKDGQSEVHVIKGTDGQEIWSRLFAGEVQLDLTEDVDGDNLSDILIAHNDFELSKGKMLALKGINGGEIWSKQYDARIGQMISLEDIDGDGKGDLCLGLGDFGVVGMKKLQALSKKSGSLIWEKEYEITNIYSVWRDFDGDQKGDIFLLNSTRPSKVQYLYQLMAVGSANGSKIGENSFTHDIGKEMPEGGDEWSHASPYMVSDLNGNGIRDVTLAMNYHHSYWDEETKTYRQYSAGKVVLIEGGDGTIIGSASSTVDEWSWIGGWMGWYDFSGDGISDVLLATRKGVYLITVGKYILGDVNKDGAVNIPDLAIVANAFNTKPGASNWNSSADLNNDSRVDIFDLVLVGRNFGKRGSES